MQGKQYTNIVTAKDYSFDKQLLLEDGGSRGYMGGYAVHLTNTTRLCQAFASDACLATKGPDVCILEMITQWTSAQQPPASSGSGVSPAVIAAAVVVPVLVVAGAYGVVVGSLTATTGALGARHVLPTAGQCAIA